MLLGALSQVHANLHRAADSKRCKLVETAIAQIAGSFKSALLPADQQPPAAVAGQQHPLQQVFLLLRLLL